MSHNNIKTVIVVVMTTILSYALISPNLLPNVTLHLKDAIIIVTYVVVSYVLLRILTLIEAKKVKKKLDTHVSQMSAMVDTAPYAIYLKNLEGTILLANEYHAKLTGIKVNKLAGRNANLLFKDSALYEKEDQEIIANKICKTAERNLVRADGKSVGWYKVTKTPVFDENQEVINILVILQDINEDKKIEEMKNTFIATITHDLKTPTVAQIKALDLLLNESFGPLTDSQKEIILQTKNSCNYMSNLIFLIIDTYMHENGRVQINKEEFDIKILIEDTINEIKNLLIEKQQNITIISKVNPNFVYGDKFQIKRVIINLVSNAINHGYEKTNIEILLDENDDSTTLIVKNHSNQISQNELEHIFDKYKQIENQRFKKASSGLGLYLSRKIIDAHFGKMIAKSTEDDISYFGFSIPKHKVTEVSVPIQL